MIEQYLLETDDTKKRPLPHNPKQKANGNHSSIDLEERLEIMQNKIKSKKVKASARALEKKKQKKLKKTKELQKKLISAAKSLKNEKAKGEKGEKRLTADANDVEDVKPEVKPDVKPPKTFNEEGKLVFSKFEFAAQPSRATKPKKDSKFWIWFQTKRTAITTIVNYNPFPSFPCRTNQRPEIVDAKVAQRKGTNQ